MSFPDLQIVQNQLNPGTPLLYVAEAQGVPVAGVNVVGLPFLGLGVDPDLIDPKRMTIDVDIDPDRPAGGTLNPGVTDVKFVSIAPDKSSISLSFTNDTGTGVCRLVLQLEHTIEAVGSDSDPVIRISGAYGGGGGGGGGGNVEIENGEAVAMTTGQVVYLSAAPNRAFLASAADAQDEAANAYAFVGADPIPAGDTGDALTIGESQLRLEPGLVVDEGQTVYLSAAVPGSATNVAPAANGNMRLPLGYIKDIQTYDGAADLLVLLGIRFGNRFQV